MSKWRGKTRKVGKYVIPALLVLAGLLGIALSVAQGGVGA